MSAPFAWFRYQQGSRVYYDTKKWDDCQPLYTHSVSGYERGFIDGMQKQMQSSVDKAVNRMAQADCPSCEYHKARAKRWREEAYKHAGHPLPEREWVGMNTIELAKQAGFERLGHTADDWVCYPKDIEAFAKLVEQHVLREWATEFAGLGEWACVNRIEADLKEKNT